MASPYPLLTALAEIADWRKSRGKRHPLAAILALAFAAVLSGVSSLTAISQWGREQGPELLSRLGLTHSPGPCVATLHRIFSRLDTVVLERVLTTWWQTWLPARGGLALDGKTVRGSGNASESALQLLAAFVQQVGVVLAECPIEGGDEIGTAIALLQGLDLHGWIVTGDAKLTQKKLVQTVIHNGGDYLLTVKANQPTLWADISFLFSEPTVVADTITCHQESSLHGIRIERRILTASSALRDYCPWVGLEQVFRSERRFTDKQTGIHSTEVHFGITSLSPQRADARRLAGLLRGHWGIENRLHWVRDVDYAEDHSRVRTSHAPHAMAIFRNWAISLIWLTGFTSVVAGLRHFAWHAERAISLVTQMPSLSVWTRMK
jgi:predicted transposase YbfD/YdcC